MQKRIGIRRLTGTICGLLVLGLGALLRVGAEEEPFTDATSAFWPAINSGNPFVVYPGKDGPIDSIRWEVFAESLQDYAILQTAGIHPDAPPLLADIKTYAEFPKTKEWHRATLEKILRATPASSRQK